VAEFMRGYLHEFALGHNPDFGQLNDAALRIVPIFARFDGEREDVLLNIGLPERLGEPLPHGVVKSTTGCAGPAEPPAPRQADQPHGDGWPGDEVFGPECDNERRERYRSTNSTAAGGQNFGKEHKVVKHS
jgi:hypothetical protein